MKRIIPSAAVAFLAAAVTAAPTLVSDIAVRNENAHYAPELANAPVPHYRTYDDGSIVVDATDCTYGCSADISCAPKERVAFPPAVAHAPALRTEPLDVARTAAQAGFSIALEIDFSDVRAAEMLYSIPGALDLYFRPADRTNAFGLARHDTMRNNHVNFPLPDGSVHILEAKLPGPCGRIGIPLGALKAARGVKKTVLNWTGSHWQIYVEDVLDEDFPFHTPAWPAARAEAQVCSPRVKAARFSSAPLPEIGAARFGTDTARPLAKPVQYFTPDDPNAWTGDVVTGFHEGRFHIFYLFDRRHHSSKAGRGGHYFAHLSSRDLKTWYEHPAAVAIDAPWETHGTGTPFAWNGRYCMAYGLHTFRSVFRGDTTWPVMRDYLKRHGEEGTFRMADLAPRVPHGGTYAISDDGGITFRKSGVLFTLAQNPTVYNREDGTFGLADYVKLMWSDRFGGWKVWDDRIPTHGDCPSVFSWNGHHYIIQGFFTMAHSPNGRPGTFTSWEETGDDIYDGLSVPMVSPFTGNRRIMAGWIAWRGCWGGWLCFRELVQYPDGKLGSKWLDETPPPVAPRTFANVPPDRPFVLRFAEAQHPAWRYEFRIDPREGRAQFMPAGTDGTAPRAKTLQELVLSLPKEKRIIREINQLPAPHRNHMPGFAIGHIRGLERPYGVRFVTWYDAKSDTTVFDAEIAGQRTMATCRPGRWSPVP